MISAFARTAKGVERHALKDGAPLPPGTVWIDLEAPTDEEVRCIEHFTRMKLPSLLDVRLLEQSEQAYVERDVIYLLAPAVVDSHSDTPRIGVFLFAMSSQILITLHQARARAFEGLATRLEKSPQLLDSSETALVAALEAVVARCADLTEIVAHEMERVSGMVFQGALERKEAAQPTRWQRTLASLGRTTRLNHKLRNTLSGIDRLVAFLLAPKHERISEVGRDHLRIIDRDLEGLVRHVDFLASESSFLLDAIIGSISIEQNNVMKLFSIVAVGLMPPTLIAGIFGMNFKFMPELEQWWGYPFALLLIVLSALLPLWFFRKRGLF